MMPVAYGEYIFVWSDNGRPYWHCKIADSIDAAFHSMMGEDYVTIPPNTVFVVIRHKIDRDKPYLSFHAELGWYKAKPVTPPLQLAPWLPGVEEN